MLQLTLLLLPLAVVSGLPANGSLDLAAGGVNIEILTNENVKLPEGAFQVTR